MAHIILVAMLWSISPFGEAKVGIPFAMFNGANIYIAFLFCFLANVLVYPLMTFFLDSVNRYFFRWRSYKKASVYIARKAKLGAQDGIQKYGFWGLMFFVLLPIPGTGVYAGTIAAYIFKIERKRAFMANTIGIFFSSVIVWTLTLLTIEGIS